jgi:hypothetical protein
MSSDEGTAGRQGRRHPRRDEPATLRLHVALEETFPPVWRRLEVASDLGLDDLHDVLQVAYGWEDRHLYRFTTGPQLRPGDAFVSPDDLRESEPDDEGAPAWQVRIDELLGVPGDRLYYQYDYGDNWWLTIELEEVETGRVPPDRAHCLDGRRRRTTRGLRRSARLRADRRRSGPRPSGPSRTSDRVRQALRR